MSEREARKGPKRKGKRSPIRFELIGKPDPELVAQFFAPLILNMHYKTMQRNECGTGQENAGNSAEGSTA